MNKSDDGVGGEEGTFCLCTLWCVEALTRAGEYEKPLLRRAVEMFEVFLLCTYQASADGMKDFLLYLNHVGLCTEEISEAGDACVKFHYFFLEAEFVLQRLGNAVQGFTYVLIHSYF